MEPVYLDYNATTPVDPEVLEAIRPYLEEHFGNASSAHYYGGIARKALAGARERVAVMIHCSPDEVYFTSNGTESNNLAIMGVAAAAGGGKNHIITSCIEHPSVASVCRYLSTQGFRISYAGVDRYGRTALKDILEAINPCTFLVSVMLANNETGTLQPVKETGDMLRHSGILFHTDASQAAGKIRIDVNELGVDLLTLAGHKFYAPKGIGVLYVRKGTRIRNILHGAGHESNLRPGTENVPYIAGLGKACEIALRDFEMITGRMASTKKLLYTRLASSLDTRLNSHPDESLPNTLNISFKGIDALTLLARVPGVAASTGSACHSGRAEISSVLRAMHVPHDEAIGAIRFSTGKYTTPEEVETAAQLIIEAIRVTHR